MASKKLFIIEDDINILYGLEAHFRNANFQVGVSEANDDEAKIISDMHKFKPDYIVLDLILPKIEGFDLLAKIKSDPILGEKEIFIFTDLSVKDSQERSLEMGADYVFFKEEFDTYNFAEKVLKIIENQKNGHKPTLEHEDDFDLVID